MDEFEDAPDGIDYEAPADDAGEGPGEGPDGARRALVERVLQDIREDKIAHAKAFKRMKRDMQIARTGRVPAFDGAKPDEEAYAANIIGRHVKMKTGALYAKNPKATAGRRDTMDFAVWDENPQALAQAMQIAQAVAPQFDALGQPIPAPPEVQLAQAIVADAQAGLARRDQIAKVGRAMEIMFAYFLSEQQPVEAHTAFKQLVRRACTTGVGYVELCFERETGAPPEIVGRMDDAKIRLAHLQGLLQDAQEGEMEAEAAEAEELRLLLADLVSQPEIVMREGLVFDFPLATRVIPDKRCRSLVGFLDARRLTIEYHYSREEAEELFGVDLSRKQPDAEAGASSAADDGITVYKHYHKPSGQVFYVAEGHPDFLREPGPPDVFVEGFWPVFALTFNEVEDEDELFPPSDVELLRSMQREYNRARQGQSEHRQAARPRFVYAKGQLDDDDAKALARAGPFSATGIDMPAEGDLRKLLMPVPVPGVDPNLYETSQVFTDVQIVGGAQEANYGGTAQATATEAAIAANATTASDTTAVDDMDAFLTRIARASGQILLREMSPEMVKAIAGPGAVWPDTTLLEDIADELYLEVEAGSSGKPNQAVEMRNWQMMLPFLLQMPGVGPTFLARQTLKRLDDKFDLTEAFVEGLPSIVAQNQQAQVGPEDPGAAPSAQGPEGAGNAPTPAGAAEVQPGSAAAFGSNQV
jgi:hypothetical protein